MFDLLAGDPEDGWAFVRRGEEILLVRPPFRCWNRSVVTESTVEQAVSTQGFVAMEGSFDGWTALIAFLEDKMVEVRKAQGQDVPTSDSIEEVLKLAPKRILKAYLDRVESEFIPNREWDAAFNLLITFVTLDTVKDDSDLRGRTLDLLKQWRTAKAQREAEKQELTNEEENLRSRFPGAAGQYEASAVAGFAQNVSERGQLLAAGV